MKKFGKLAIAGAFVLSMIPVIQSKTITANAETYTVYKMNCSGSTPYEVDTINDSGTFDPVGCYVNFNDAKTAMGQAGLDAVVRHGSTLSSNQIIAMTRGYVYSASYRSSTALITVNGNGTSTYMGQYMPMHYEGTVSYDGAGNGTVSVNAFGFTGTIPLLWADFVPQKFFDKQLSIYAGGNDTNGASAWWLIPQQNYFTVERHGNYLDLVSRCYSSEPHGGGTKGECFSDLRIGPAADWMAEGAVYYSVDDVNFYSDSSFTQKAGTYYNYYLYQPLRTKSKIPVEQYNSFLEWKNQNSSSKLWNMGSLFLADQAKYGMNAAMVFIQACIESAYGVSNLALAKNNLFGVAAYDTDFGAATTFNSAEDAINNQMGPFLRGYADTEDYRFYGGYYGDKGGGIATKYASSATYGMTLASLYYSFDKFANDYNGNLTDCNSYSIGFINQISNVYSDTSESKVLYNTSYGGGSGYTKNFAVVILGEEGNYYRVQSTDYIRNGSIANWSQETDHTYDWSTMVGYVRKTDVEFSGAIKAVSDPMYRLYNPNSGEHFYTKNASERDNLVSLGWSYEGVGWTAPSISNTPVYRLYNPNAGEHHYTTDAAERDSLVSVGWNYEGIGWYSDDNKAVPLYRQYNPNAFSCNHNYTPDANERDYLISLGWRDEGIGWYGVKN